MTGTVALLGLSGYEAEQDRTERARAYFAGRGFSVLAIPDPQRRVGRFTGSDPERLAALHGVAANPDITLVIGLRGGYGITRLLDRIDYGAIARSINERGVHWVGHSDWTALLLSVYARTGAVTLAGPMATADFGEATIDPYTESTFWSVLAGRRRLVTWPDAGPSRELAGPLWGGNLAMLCSLLGTPYMPQVKGGILFLEDVNERPYRIERMLLQLLQANVLPEQRAIVLGHFTGYSLGPADGGYDLEAVVAYLRSRLDVPIFTGLPFGHVSHKCTLPVGAWVRLSARDGQVSLTVEKGGPGGAAAA